MLKVFVSATYAPTVKPPVFMITIRTSTIDPFFLDMQINRPSVYLDYCVIGDLAENPIAGSNFQRILEMKNGTLCLSTIHLLELFGLGTGKTYNRIKSFLDSFANRFAILDFDPKSVIAKEQNWKEGNPCPVFDLETIKLIINQWNGLSKLTFGILLDGLENNPNLAARLQNLHRQQVQSFHELFNSARQVYKTNHRVKMNVEAMQSPDPRISSSTECIFFGLKRQCYKQDLALNDGFDFLHSVVSTAYCDYVVLDKKWASRVRNLELPTQSAKVFATNEYNNFIKTLAV